MSDEVPFPAAPNATPPGVPTSPPPLPDLRAIAARIARLKAWVKSPWFRERAPRLPRERADALHEVRRLRQAIEVLLWRDYQTRLDAYLLGQAQSWVEADAAETEAELLETMGRTMPRCEGGKRCRHDRKWRHRQKETIDQWVTRLREQRRRVQLSAANVSQG